MSAGDFRIPRTCPYARPHLVHLIVRPSSPPFAITLSLVLAPECRKTYSSLLESKIRFFSVPYSRHAFAIHPRASPPVPTFTQRRMHAVMLLSNPPPTRPRMACASHGGTLVHYGTTSQVSWDHCCCYVVYTTAVHPVAQVRLHHRWRPWDETQYLFQAK